jgi:hypothetical protein
MKANFIIVHGSPADGFLFVGPFTYHGDAEKYASTELDDCAWWIAPIEQPED